jgi:hypothetical protein
VKDLFRTEDRSEVHESQSPPNQWQSRARHSHYNGDVAPEGDLPGSQGPPDQPAAFR